MLTYRDIEAMLIRLGDSTSDIVLVGGQAVNFWAEQYIKRIPELSAHAPYASKDIDFCGTRTAVIACAQRLGGRALLPTGFDPTPNSGQVVFADTTGTTHVIDFLSQPFGLDAADVLRTSIPVDVLNNLGQKTGARFRVMHPERCMESRIHNIAGLPGYDSERALAQLRAMVLCTREFLRDLLSAGRIRPALALIERIFHVSCDQKHGRTVCERYGIDPFSAVTQDARLPAEFNDLRYPQMVSRLAARRRTV